MELSFKFPIESFFSHVSLIVSLRFPNTHLLGLQISAGILIHFPQISNWYLFTLYTFLKISSKYFHLNFLLIHSLKFSIKTYLQSTDQISAPTWKLSFKFPIESFFLNFSWIVSYKFPIIHLNVETFHLNYFLFKFPDDTFILNFLLIHLS